MYDVEKERVTYPRKATRAMSEKMPPATPVAIFCAFVALPKSTLFIVFPSTISVEHECANEIGLVMKEETTRTS